MSTEISVQGASLMLTKEGQIEVMIRSGYPIIYMTTWEERRALKTLRRVS